MTQTQKIIEEFEEKFIPLKPGFSVAKDWTKNLGGTTANYMILKSFLLSSLHQVATEAIEAVKVEKKEMSYNQEERKVLEEIFGKYETPEYLRERIYGYNSAISDMEQKAKKFLENNYKNISQ